MIGGGVEIDQRPIPVADPRMRGAWVALLAATAVYVAFWPRTLVNGDEVYYLGQARSLLSGHLFPVPNGPYPMIKGGAPVLFPLGWPLILAPFAALHAFRAVYLASLIAYLAGGWAFARILVRRSVPSYLAAVLLFHPLYWPLARTLMSDTLGAALFLLSIDAWESRRDGLLFGSVAGAIAVRLAGLFPGMGVGLTALWELANRKRSVATIVAAGAVGSALLLASQQLTNGTWTSSHYAIGSAMLITPWAIPYNLVLYGAGLLLIPPFPLACLLLRRSKCDRWWVAAVPVLAFFMAYGYHDSSTRWLETLLGGQRLVLSAHLALLVSTARVWSAFPLLDRPALVVGAGAAAGVVGVLATRHLEDRYAPARDTLVACHASSIGYNFNASRVALAVDAPQMDLLENGIDPADDVEIISPAAPTNQPINREPNFPVPASIVSRSKACARRGEFLIFDVAGRCGLAPTADCKTMVEATRG